MGILDDVADNVENLSKEIGRLERELEQHRWIPVSERLPKNDLWVLCVTKAGAYRDRYCGERWQFETDYIHYTHWKPIILPEQALKETENAANL